MGRWLARLVVLSGLWSSSAWAQQREEPLASAANREAPTPADKYFGVGASLGFYQPNGLLVRAGLPAAALELAGGFTPIALSYGSDRDPKLKFLAPLEGTTVLIVQVLKMRHELRGALRLGYRYNAALSHGATLGGQISKRISPHWDLEGLWGVSYYPKARSELRGRDVPADASFNFPPELNWGLNVQLVFLP